MIREFVKDRLTVQVSGNRSLLGTHAAAMVAGKIKELHSRQELVNIIFAAAPSQNEFLDALVKQTGIEWGRVNAFHMDDYLGLPEDAPQRFGNYLKQHIFSRVPFRVVNYINSNPANAEQECKRYATLLQAYPADIVCMGIGENAHLAFNDPPADFSDPLLVKIVELDQVSRQQQVNDRCFERIEDVPVQAITLTIPALLGAPYIFCMVPGPTKVKAVYYTLHSKIEEQVPSTILRKHKNAVLFIDSDSAMLLSSFWLPSLKSPKSPT